MHRQAIELVKAPCFKAFISNKLGIFDGEEKGGNETTDSCQDFNTYYAESNDMTHMIPKP